MTTLTVVPTPTLHLVGKPDGVTDQDLDNWASSKSPTIRRLVAEVRRLGELIETVTVCSGCLRASCWHAWDQCENHALLGSIELPVTALEALNRETPDWWT